MTMYGIRTINRGIGPWVELAKSLTNPGGVIVFADKPLTRAYASNAGIRGEVFPYDENGPTVQATKSDMMGWTYK